ncbi:MAG TPA: energy-coupled thiamine transporter ThiT, partial [Candidatus Cryosericum sp.]|nr:energy-coupled thiamine transporter ThiT [Candidatus Cryosericum sp.]
MERTPRRAITVKEMAEMGIAVALGVALSYLSKAIWSMPMGGTLELGVIPVFYIALKWGSRDGFIVGLALGLITLVTDPYFVHPIQILLDYPLPG